MWRSSLSFLTFTGVRSEQVGRAGGRDHHHLYGAALPRHAPPPRSGTRSLVFQRALERTRIRMPPDSASGEPRSLRHLIPQTGCIQLLSLSSYPSCSHGALSTLHEAVFPPRGWRAYPPRRLLMQRFYQYAPNSRSWDYIAKQRSPLTIRVTEARGVGGRVQGGGGSTLTSGGLSFPGGD